MGESLLQQVNILKLVDSADGPRFLAKWDRRLKGGLLDNRRGCLDMAGKLPLCLKALHAGISADELLVDVAQAGGLHGRSDGMLRAADGRLEPLEIKGASAKKDRAGSFVFKSIRMRRTSWQHLFFIGRQRSGIAGWRLVADFEDCMWLGYVSRRAFERAMARAGRSSAKMVDVTVSPGSARTWGWLRAAVKWVRLKSLTRQWWLGNVVVVLGK